ncbi:MAG: nickel pincer cofactor biosynthesis protein LarC [Myxococcota bacterium]
MLHLDAFSGAAGNMFLAAMLDLGLSRSELEQQLAGLDLPHSLKVRKVSRGALSARHVRVAVPGGARRGHGRHYREIVDVIAKAQLDDAVRDRALAIFEALARAEATVHGSSISEVHFHEVGAIDAIVDVTAAAIASVRLEIRRVTCGPVALGEGTVETAHGLLPLPAPATLELLRGVPTVPAHVAWETVTPTGAAILRTLVDEFCSMPAMTIEKIGHGAGEDRPGPMPNVLRAVLGRSGRIAADRVVALETNLDDLVPEHFDYLMERLLEAGALDVSIQHIQMKKNRPGFLVRVLARPADRIALAGILFAESTAIGVRSAELDRVVLEREQMRVDTAYGRIGVKVVWDLEGRPLVSAEYDDCKQAARKSGAPLRDVVRAAEEAARDGLD